MEFLLRNWGLICEGGWPPEPRDTGYTDIAGVVKRKGKRRGGASFELPCCIKAELDVRLKLLNERERSVLVDIYILGYSEEEAAMIRRITDDTLRRRKNRGMRGLVGWRRQSIIG